MLWSDKTHVVVISHDGKKKKKKKIRSEYLCIPHKQEKWLSTRNEDNKSTLRNRVIAKADVEQDHESYVEAKQ